MPVPAPAVVPPAQRQSGELDLLLDALPEALRTQLNDSALTPETIAEINAWFAKEKLHKPVKMTMVIHTSELTPNDPNRYRIRAEVGLLSGKYAVVPHQQLFAYLPSADATEIAKEPIGASVTLSGRIGRCDLKQFPAGVRINVDIFDTVWIKDAPAK